jgi:uncharacterized protein YdeI (YjbR/CyaY-like superfamily)
MELKDGIKAVPAKSAKEWRKWLEKNHFKEKAVWLIMYKKDSGIASVYYPDAVTEALCFGWIDSKANTRDELSYYQFFAKRNPKSKWSKINRDKVELLMELGLMAPAGIELVNIAKQSGTWTALDQVELLEVPLDLKKAFGKNKAAFNNWENFPRSSRRGILEWILNAKKPETRIKRIEETVLLAAENIKANHYRQ